LDTRRTTGPDTIGGAYTGISRTTQYTGTYTGVTPANFFQNFLGAVYSGPYQPPTGSLVPYAAEPTFPVGPFVYYYGPPPPGQQQGYTVYYTGPAYTGTIPANYDGQFSQDFTTDYIGTAFVTTVQGTTETVTTNYLWVRTA
jgi:hypothetical protein